MQFLGLEATVTSQGFDELQSKLAGVSSAATQATAPMQAMSQATDEAKESASGLDRMVERLTERFGIYEVLHKTVEALHEFTEEGLAAAEATNLLNFQLEQASPGVEGLSMAADSVVRSVSEMGKSTNLEATQALQRLIMLTGDTQWSMQHLAEAQDIASASGRDLTFATLALARAHEGEFGQLERVFPYLKDTSDQMQVLYDRTHGATEQLLENAGAWTKLGTAAKNAFEDLGASVAVASAPIAEFLAKFPSSLSARILEGVLTLGGSEIARLLSGPGNYAPGTGPAGSGGLGGLLAMPPLTPGLGVTTTGAPASAAEASIAYLRYQKEQYENQLKQTQDAGERLRILNEIYEINQRITDELKEQNKMSAEQAAAAEAIVKMIPHEAGRERYLGTGPSIGALDPRLAPGANTLTGMGQQAPDNLTGQGASRTAQLQQLWDSYETSLHKFTVDFQSEIETSFDSIGDTLGRAIASLAERGHGKNAFKMLSDGLLESFGEMVTSLGKAVIAQGVAMLAVQVAIAGFSPAEVIAAGIAMVAIGEAFASIVGSSMGGGGGGGSSATGSGAGSAGRYIGSVAPTNLTSYQTPGAGAPFAAGEKWPGGPMTPITIVGTNDPTAQRQLVQTLVNGVRRGLTVPGIGGN